MVVRGAQDVGDVLGERRAQLEAPDRLAAHDRHSGLFRRFELMSNWVREDELAFSDIITPDGLHMNDWAYGCVAQGLAQALNRAARNSMIGRADISN